MLSHNTIESAPNSRKPRMRVGRGVSSGKGGTSGRGNGGQNSRTGRGKFNAAFEGGQTPLFRRMPKKRGFTAYAPNVFSIVNVSTLQKLATEGITTIDSEVLVKKGIIPNIGALIKLLGNGEITSSVTIRIHKASAQAQEKVIKAGGTVEIL
ncbi:50S ribosomal protein L15 [Candidatus Gracilibacteria bacterium CG2_30_37_12]|nr:MAG: 50S ribosomal protein L15 [Candidatus Gracilibacteria bacterium CG2_30_37_12]